MVIRSTTYRMANIPHRVASVQDPTGQQQSAAADMEQQRWTCRSACLMKNCYTPTGWMTGENKLGKNRTGELKNSKGEPTGLKQHYMLYKTKQGDRCQLQTPNRVMQEKDAS